MQIKLEQWYATEYKGHLNKKDLFLILQQPGYRPQTWVPAWDLKQYQQGELDNCELLEAPMDPRLDRHWRNSDWDDVLIPQWWRWVVWEYKRHCYERHYHAV